MAKKQKPTLKVANIELILGNTYEIIPKKDFDAPSGFKEHGTTKLLMPGISEIRAVPFDQGINLWDTGFDSDSPVNAKIPPAERAALSLQYNKLIKEPYEKRFRKDLSSTNNDFWDEYTYELHTYKTFDTANEKDLLDLFQALVQGRICEVGEKDATLQRTANYSIRNREKETSLKEERAETKFEAFAIFSTLLKADFKKDDTLISVLEWVGLTNIRETDKETLKKTVLRMLEDPKNGYEFSERFVKAFNMTETNIGKEIMDLFSILQKLRTSNKIEVKRQQYYIDGIKIGNHLKEAAEVANKNPEIKELILKTYEELTK
jgi:hypothetical protein